MVWPGAWRLMNSAVIDARDFGSVSTTMAPSSVRGPRLPVTTSSSTTEVPVDCARAWPPSSRLAVSVVVAQSARLNILVI